jgi:DNA-binding beta-propeller fold protein YncE
LVLLCVLVVLPELPCGIAVAADFDVSVKSIAQIRVDDDGRTLGYPLSVFYDPTEDEIYVVNATSGRVVVYGPDFFPRSSMGEGRGIGAPRGGEVEPNGDVYICQARFRNSTAHRITIMNGAFFMDRDINLDDIPEAKGLSPRSVAVNHDGIIYVAGDNSRGVLVLDKDGTFLRWLKPTDKSLGSATDAEAEQRQNGEIDQPKEDQAISSDKDDKDAAVKVNYVAIDSAGKLYLLSAEIGKIFVYGPDEKLLFSFGTKGGSPRQLSQPKALAIDENRGLIYVVDYMRHTILTYDLSGKFLFEFGGRGTGPCWFNFPCGIAVNRHGQVIVADQFNRRVQVLDVRQSGMFGMPAAVVSSKGSDAAGMTKGSDATGTTDGSDAAGMTDGTDAAGMTDGADAAETAAPDKSLSGQQDVGVKEVTVPDSEIPGYPDAANEGQAAPVDGVKGQVGGANGQKTTPESSPTGPGMP